MLAASRAHALMLIRQRIISRELGSRLLVGLAALEKEDWRALSYDGRLEDLFFSMQDMLRRSAGDEAAGNLQIARSRNDLDVALCRWVVREGLLNVVQQCNRLRHRVLAMARTHLDTIMPAYTHAQPAQPTTLAHYLSAVAAFLERDTARFQAAYSRTNVSPLGAVALTTTGFPIDRVYLAQLLGFDAPVENSYDAVGGADYQAEVAATIQVAAASLSRFVTDLIFWATKEAAALRIGGEFLQISSNMPQKRNPVVLEHVRTQLGYLYADAQGVITLHHNTPLGDVNDIDDPIFRLLFRLLDYAIGIYELLEAVLTTAVWDTTHLANRAAEEFITATELADTLVREAGLTFLQAHQVVSQLVENALKTGLREVKAVHLDAAAMATLRRPLGLSDKLVGDALRPSHFIAIRTIPGGPAPTAMTALLDSQTARIAQDERWQQDRRERLTMAHDRLNQEIQRTLAEQTTRE
jgi:argininosuccinate lyase